MLVVLGLLGEWFPPHIPTDLWTTFLPPYEIFKKSSATLGFDNR